MAKPKKAFSVNMGGNSSADDIAKYQEELKAAKPRQKKELAAPQPRDVPPDQPPLPLEDVAAYDFRMLKEPEKTLQRVQALLSDPRLTHGERAAAALIALQFQDRENTQVLSVKRILTESRGFSSSVRDRLFPKLEALRLVKSRWLRGIGTEITLLF